MSPSMSVDNYSEVKDFKNRFGAMMSKTQGFSKGFVSEYRHAVDNNMADESEGFGSSGRVEAYMTASEDSSAPKRKCISLNVDSSEGFGIPVEYFSMSKMSGFQRKQLELRLRTELTRVQHLQKKITVEFTDVAVSSSSDIHNFSNGKKGAFPRNMHRKPELLHKEGNKMDSSRQSNQSLKGSLSGRFESVKREIPLRAPDSMLMEQCEALLKRVMGHEYGWVFNVPVDVVKLNIPDYFTVIKHPMDLGTVKSKMSSHQYPSPWGFLDDVRLTFSNAMTYNPPNNDVHIMAKILSKFFEVRWKNIQKKLPPIDSVPVAAKSSFSRESKVPKPSSPSKKRKITTIDHGIKTESVKPIMTEEAKHILSQDLESLLSELPPHIIDFLRAQSEGQAAGEEEIEVDIDLLSDDTLFTLRKLVDDFLLEKRRNRAKVERGEVDLLNESGISNSSMQLGKANDPVDEEVDVGGNDLPAPSFPPVEIEKDTAHRNSKCSSSSSSSSDSSSSSSDSDTGSSSSSDADGGKASSPVNKENLNSNAASVQQTNNLLNSRDGNQSLSGLDQLERNPQTKPVSFEVDSRQAEENAPPENQVPSDKHYRAAVLRNRFADTILKARVKTLNEGAKGDPEKLRREREELERQQREEKARLQAEAKAAEDARMQAEAEAAAEAKRKREFDREAARQALQQMERTVEINENCRFLEDLEMLRSAPAPHLPLTNVISPDYSSDGMGGFKLQGSNPLEQLGLYMKMDDEEEEEEECEPTSVPVPVNDAEEGEID